MGNCLLPKDTYTLILFRLVFLIQSYLKLFFHGVYIYIYNITALRFVQSLQKILSSFTQQLQRSVKGGEFMDTMDRNQAKY